MSLSKRVAKGSQQFQFQGPNRSAYPAPPGSQPPGTTAVNPGPFSRPGLIARVRHNRRGAAAAEFAMVAPVMMGLLFGTFEYGIAFFSYSAMHSAIRDVGRQIAVNTLVVGSAESAIRNRLPPWARAGATVQIAQSAPTNPAANVYTVTVTMPMRSATPIQFFSKITNPTLRAELRMKQELPYVAIN